MRYRTTTQTRRPPAVRSPSGRVACFVVLSSRVASRSGTPYPSMEDPHVCSPSLPLHRRPACLVRAPLAMAVCLLLATPAVALADAAGEPAAKNLDTVVVTASGNQQWIKDAPASISVISREDIERQPVHDLGTLLSRIPGVTGGLSAAGEQSKIKLRGMPSNYTLILVDGKRVGSSASTNYRPDLGRQDLNWISPDQIERIEVVRGPMSSLYGSDAMGG